MALMAHHDQAAQLKHPTTFFCVSYIWTSWSSSFVWLLKAMGILYHAFAFVWHRSFHYWSYIYYRWIPTSSNPFLYFRKLPRKYMWLIYNCPTFLATLLELIVGAPIATNHTYQSPLDRKRSKSICLDFSRLLLI